MNRRIGICLVACLLAFPPGAPAQEKAVIEGVVTALGTGVAISGAQVFAGSAGKPSVNATTDSNGVFSLSVDAGEYRLTASQTGFVSQQYGQRGEGPGGTPITVTPGQKVSNVTFRLPPTGTITGRIYDPEGHPMEGINVSVSKRGWDGTGHRTLTGAFNGRGGGATTNDLGEYRLYWLPPGDYFVSARSSGSPGLAARNSGSQTYVNTYYPGVQDPNQGSSIHLTPGSELRGVDFSLARTRTTTVTGRVIMPPVDDPRSVIQLNMIPIENALGETGTVNVNYQTKAFTIPNVTPGRYRLVASLRIPNKGNLSGETLIEVADTPIDVAVTVTNSRTLTGKITFDDSQTDAKLLVSLRSDPNIAFLMASGSVEPNGDVVLPDVGEANYSVFVNGLPPDFYVSSARMGGVDVLDHGFRLTRETPKPLEISLSGQGGRVQGQVREGQTDVVPGARVVLVPNPSLRQRIDLFKVVTADQYGRFDIRGIVPGDYKLFAWDDVPIGAYYDPEYLRQFEDKVKSFKVAKSDLLQIEVQLVR